MAVLPASELMLMILPAPAARIPGRTAFTMRTMPKKFVSNCAFASSTLVSSAAPIIAYPALLTSTSSRPAFVITCATHARTDSSDRTSSASVLPGMRAAGAGKIINISSLAGNTAIPYSAFYSASKFAVEGYSESLWYEIRPLGISVSLVEPGFVNTPIGEASPAAARPLPAYDATRKRMLAAFGHALEGGIPAEHVARRVLQIIGQREPRLRYRVGTQATWLPRVRNVVPWKVYAAGVRKTFAV